MTAPDSLPTDADALRALLLAERARHGEERERWMAIIAERARIGWVNERFVPPVCPPQRRSKGAKRERC